MITAKCAWCGVEFEKKHQRTVTCGKRECSYGFRAKRYAAKNPPRGVLAAAEIPAPAVDAEIRALLKKKSLTVVELANQLDRSPRTIEESLARLKDAATNVVSEGERITINAQVATGGKATVDMSRHVGQWRKFGATGDWHMGNKHCRLDVIAALYDRYEEEGITEVYHTGNMIEGEARFSRPDLKVWGLDNQVDFFIQNTPQRKGITTHMVAGDDHEGWHQQREGIIIGRHIEQSAIAAGRHDLKYLGYMEADIELKTKNGAAIMRVLHPGGGSSYAISYTDQKRVESYQGGEKPHVELAGHYHKFNYGYPREVHTVQTGCCCDQTTFMRKKRLAAHVGGVIVWVNQAEDGSIQRFRAEWLPFYDKGFYTRSFDD